MDRCQFGVALVIAGVGGCNVHEFGHLVVGRALEIPIDDVIWCAPTGGRIAFAYQEPALVGYAGGFLAAAVLGSLYWFVIRPRLSSPVWWAAGVAVLGTTISQVIVGLWEGSSPVEYGAAQGNVGGLMGPPDRATSGSGWCSVRVPETVTRLDAK
ncbi:MAG TPA: hypothetical protein VF148_10825 [Acidimicrobiia bacterium]